MNYKEQFKSWVFNNLTEKSGAGSSYISSLDWLSDRFYEKNKISKKSIFEIEDIDLITELHSEVKRIQRDKNSFIYNKNAPSYGERYFYSASLSKYKEFLQFKNGGLIIEKSKKKINKVETKFYINSFSENVFESGLVFSETLITRFVASLLTKPFVLLTGLSGSGKTKIAQSFVQWICEDESQYKIIPVGADWTNREPLLGYPNGLNPKEYITPDSGALNLIVKAAKKENSNKPYFLILDEMNLSHVERYFADFLSVMESDDKINLYSGTVRKDLDGNDIPNEIIWTKNIFIIGTVNIDETTYMFSPKVLDRANTIEFRVDEINIKSFFDLPSKIDLSVLKTKGASMGKSFLEIAVDNSIEKDDEHTDILVKFFNELKKVGAEFGYRTAFEMLLLIKKLNVINTISKNESIDIAVMQKLLPKLHGSRSKIVKVLDALILLCLKDGQTFSIAKSDEVLPANINYPIAFEKLVRMYKNALDNGFTSYAEA
jgi:5-methylcytosine-specific restriction protein B